MLLNNLFENDHQEHDMLDILTVFLPFVVKELGLKKLPKIHLEKFIDDPHQPTFGKFDSNTNEIHLGLENRHPLDILRTLAHELVHFRQGTEHELAAGSGRTGSPEENEAHEVAGVVMRNFNKAHPQFFKAKPIEF